MFKLIVGFIQLIVRLINNLVIKKGYHQPIGDYYG